MAETSFAKKITKKYKKWVCTKGNTPNLCTLLRGGTEPKLAYRLGGTWFGIVLAKNADFGQNLMKISQKLTKFYEIP